MDTFIAGLVVMEFCFYQFILGPSVYHDSHLMRLVLYAVALAAWHPIHNRMAASRQRQQRAVGAVDPAGDTVSIRLPENIVVTYAVAPTWRRIYATIIDLFHTGAYCFLAVIVTAIGGSMLGVSNRFAEMALSTVVVLTALGWSVLSEYRNDGQTPGKKTAGIRTIHHTGRALTFTEAFARGMLRLSLCLPPLLVMDMVLVRTQGWSQRLGDLAAGTVVITDPVGR